MSKKLQMFIPLAKADAAQRLVFGHATAEAPDRVGEICDYATTKPYYEKWSGDIAKASGGKSLGNLRAMHGQVAAGKIASIAFNDVEKRIEIAAKVVDEAEWRKIEEGVYTGFSQGGAYVKRWPDPENPKLTRYTAAPSEISLVDYPCLPGAVFELVKADGVCEKRDFARQSGAPAAIAPPVERWSDLVASLSAPPASAETAHDLAAMIFKRIEADFADRRIDGPAVDNLAKLKTFILAPFKPLSNELRARDSETVASGAAKKDADEALRKAMDGVEARLADFAARLQRLERAPAPAPFLLGYAPVEKSRAAAQDDLAEALARLPPQDVSLLLIKAAQSHPRTFG